MVCCLHKINNLNVIFQLNTFAVVLNKLIIIPTYNEKDNIVAILRVIFSLQQHFHVLVVDDGSPDGTARIVKNLFPEYPDCLFIEERKGKMGLGTAYIHGFKWAIKARL